MKLALTLEVEVDVSYFYTPPSPGRIIGPPESCYPPEAEEIEIYLTEEQEAAAAAACIAAVYEQFESREVLDQVVEHATF